MTNASLSPSETAFRLKGNLFTLSVIQLLNADLSLIEQQLFQAIQRAPKLFANMPVVIDLQKLHRDYQHLDFVALSSLLKNSQLIPIGVRGGSTVLNEQALSAGLAIMPGSQEMTVKTDEPIKNVPIAHKSSMVITKPVRSGQQIYAEGCDLVILASVSPGAEILADGNIHIYGSLHGRALAGVNGNENTHIFCRQLNAELIAIAGNYMIKEDIDKCTASENHYKHICLEQGHLQVKELE